MTGRRPTIAAPTPRPAKPSSEMGASTTRALPNLSSSPWRHLVGAVVARDLLAHQEDVGVALHLLGERLVQRLAVRNLSHRSCPRRSRRWPGRLLQAAFCPPPRPAPRLEVPGHLEVLRARDAAATSPSSPSTRSRGFTSGSPGSTMMSVAELVQRRLGRLVGELHRLRRPSPSPRRRSRRAPPRWRSSCSSDELAQLGDGVALPLLLHLVLGAVGGRVRHRVAAEAVGVAPRAAPGPCPARQYAAQSFTAS